MNNSTDGFIRSRLDSIKKHMVECSNMIPENILDSLTESEKEFREHGLCKSEKHGCISVAVVTDNKYFNINVLYLSGIITISICDMRGKDAKARMFQSPYPCIAQDVDMVIDYFDEFLDGFTIDTFEEFKPKQEMVQEICLR